MKLSLRIFFVISSLAQIDQPTSTKANEPEIVPIFAMKIRENSGGARQRVVIHEGRLTGWVGNLWCRNARKHEEHETRRDTPEARSFPFNLPTVPDATTLD